ncbi:hypothetical protein LWC33_18540 [Pseudonocardia sp. RS11V-5]|uniref:hypothetical protein n=1 Tax=Pseudonocardia terrae TaxID=2905831 RepID=UPI001E3FFB8C|nr:hypothetical protein [Pseudonocardia terrae]MCE3553445.1 hypothetical protein [Pseudonocardia terrae]
MGESDNARPRNRSTSRRGAQGSSSSVLTPPTGLPAVDDLATPGVAVPAQRTGEEAGAPIAPPVAPRPQAPAPAGVCVCGHEAGAHEHYRPGDDCGACGAAVCGHYTPADGSGKKGLLGRLFRR